MKLSKDHMIDDRTKLPNFISFFTADFDRVYGGHGTLLMFRVKRLSVLNEKYGREIADRLLECIGVYIGSMESTTSYRHEGNNFLIVHKEKEYPSAKHSEEGLIEVVNTFERVNNIQELTYVSKIISYDQPIMSIADYYNLFYDVYVEETEHYDGRVMMHSVLETLSYRINELIREYENARNYAFYDEISCLPNSKSARMYLDEIENSNQMCAVIFIDGDSLKRFNNVSYDNGNDAIKEIAEIIQLSVRKSDKVFRWLSGDEFIVVATNIDYDDTVRLAERIRSNVQNKFSGREIPATVSLGISMYPYDGDNIDIVIDNAEQANKAAKDRGKNCYVFHSEIGA